MKIKTILSTAFTVGTILLAGTANAVTMDETINFDGADITPFSYELIPANVQDSANGNCPQDGAEDLKPCLQLNKEDSIIISVATPPGTFNLISFWWRGTGSQANSALEVTYLPTGQLPALVGEGSVFETVNLSAISEITFKNITESIVRLDAITLTYDDGNGGTTECEEGQILEGDICVDIEDPVDVPEPGTLGLLGLGLLGMAARRRRTV